MKSTVKKNPAAPVKINPKMVNASAIGREVGYSAQYVWYLLNGYRTNPDALDKVMKCIDKNLNVA